MTSAIMSSDWEEALAAEDFVYREKRTKIVATIGPASRDRETLKQMLHYGVNVVRLNFSHGTHEDHAEVVHHVRELAAERGQPVAILGDLRGPRIRIGEVENDQVMLETGQNIILTPESCLGTSERVSISFPKLSHDLKRDDWLLLDDGNIHLQVREITGSGDIHCVVTQGASLSSRRGINVPGIRISLPPITQKDLIDIDFAIEQSLDYLALSFVQSASDIQTLKTILAAKDSDIAVIAKIEMSGAMKDIERIVDEADGVMVARGDLALEMSFREIPIAQKRIISICRVKCVPVITATQLLESMINATKPTRAEVTDVANAVFDGTDALMLSGETAIGRDPAETIRVMSRVAYRAEMAWAQHEVPRLPEVDTQDTVGATISYAAQFAAEHISAASIVSYTRTGGTARRISRFRPDAPIIVLTPSKRTYNQLALSWGVTTVMVDNMTNTDLMTRRAIDIVKEMGLAKSGDKIIITSGNPSGPPGNTNLMRIEQV